MPTKRQQSPPTETTALEADIEEAIEPDGIIAADGTEISPLTGKLSSKERIRKALQLKLAGATYQQIADELGYNSRQAAWGAVKTALEGMITSDATMLRDIQYARLEQLLLTNWPDALKKDSPRNPQASMLVLSIHDRLAAMFGLNAPERFEVEEHHEGVLHVRGDKDEYIKKLREARERTLGPGGDSNGDGR